MLLVDKIKKEMSEKIEFAIGERYASISDACKELEITRPNIYRVFDNDERSTFDNRLSIIFKLGGYFFIEDEKFHDLNSIKLNLINYISDFKENGAHTSNEILKMARIDDISEKTFNSILKSQETGRQVKLQAIIYIYSKLFPRKKIGFEV